MLWGHEVFDVCEPLQAKGELDSKKVRHAKLRATPGAKEESVSAAERDVSEGELRVKNTRIG